MFNPLVPSFLFKLAEKKISVVFLSNFSIIEKAIGTKSFGNILGKLSSGVSTQPYKKL
jgi:hypothetical protein